MKLTNNKKRKFAFKKKVMHEGLNTLILSKLKAHTTVSDLQETSLSNILNWSTKDIVKIENGEKELGIKEIDMLCKHLQINPDTLFHSLSFDENDSKVFEDLIKKHKKL
ncbi:hypothetical protein ABSA28_00684 [Candidatus Hepatincolaceae symbiont of Richtersius coronifer]